MHAFYYFCAAHPGWNYFFIQSKEYYVALSVRNKDRHLIIIVGDDSEQVLGEMMNKVNLHDCGECR